MTETPVSTYRNFIDGQWVAAESAETFDNRNPANQDDLLGCVPRSSAADVDTAVAAARAAFPHWRLVPAPKRAEILYNAAQILSDRKEALAHTMTREMGKILDETRGDVQEAVDMAQLMAGEGRRMYGQTVPSELRDKFAMSMRQPIGVCGMITAWNFPIAVPSWKILPALVCGNTVVFKPAEEAPASAVNFVQALVDAGVPKGVLNLVLGDGPGAGAPLLAHPDVNVISFTGSTETGRLVNQACAPSVQESASRDGRQERHPRHGRRQSRPGGRRRACGVASARRGSAARPPAASSCMRRSTGGSSSLRRPGTGAAGRRRPGPGDRDGAQRQRRAACSG